MVADTLSEVWNLEVLCPCTGGGAKRCAGGCLGHSVRALGISMMVRGGVGVASAHPSAHWPTAGASATVNPSLPRKGLPRLPCLHFY